MNHASAWYFRPGTHGRSTPPSTPSALPHLLPPRLQRRHDGHQPRRRAPRRHPRAVAQLELHPLEAQRADLRAVAKVAVEVERARHHRPIARGLHRRRQALVLQLLAAQALPRDRHLEAGALELLELRHQLVLHAAGRAQGALEEHAAQHRGGHHGQEEGEHLLAFCPHLTAPRRPARWASPPRARPAAPGPSPRPARPAPSARTPTAPPAPAPAA